MLIIVNTVNLMNDLVNPTNSTLLAEKNLRTNQSSMKGLYVREDDQDWGSAGMDNIQKDS